MKLSGGNSAAGQPKERVTMKTLLTIGGNTLLLPQNSDPAAILKLLVGAQAGRHDCHFTKETQEHRNGIYLSAYVIPKVGTERLAVECVPDDEVCTEAEWQARIEAANARAEQ